jgi:uncharacterized protein
MEQHPLDLQPAIASLLEVSTLTLATVSPAGEPHAAPVYFAAVWRPHLELCFFSEEKTRHVQHLAQNPRLAAAIYPEASSWQDIRGLQLHGRAGRISPGPEWDQAWTAYTQKFPFVRGLKAVVARSDFYRLTPTWIRLVDNRQGFGYKQEWNLH